MGHIMNDLIVRAATVSDAKGFLDLWDALDTETEFMLFEPNERQANLASQTERLSNATGSNFVHILVCEDKRNNELAGFCAGRRSKTIRDQHVLELVIGIRESYTNKKLGQKLMVSMEQWAKHIGVTRMELSVMVSNTLALALYKKQGFVVEGTKTRSVLLKSGYADEYSMAKLI